MSDQRISVFITGNLVDLIPLNSEHINLYAKWENDPYVRLYSRNIIPKTPEDMTRFLEPSEKGTMKEEISFEVWHQKDNKPIGYGEVADIDWYSQIGWLGLVIGEPEYWGQKIGEEVIALMIEYAFSELNFFKLHAGVISANIGSWKCIEKNGFIREAILRNETYVHGKYYDYFIYSLFKDNWVENKKQITQKRKNNKF
ncbi:MAG: N-acetyltransferase [Candidatus Lokiarchaeota archaeon]|nr:N-acetyltransferase [Candidatus Lokiarchaeota archaeon]